MIPPELIPRHIVLPPTPPTDNHPGLPALWFDLDDAQHNYVYRLASVFTMLPSLALDMVHKLAVDFLAGYEPEATAPELVRKARQRFPVLTLAEKEKLPRMGPPAGPVEALLVPAVLPDGSRSTRVRRFTEGESERFERWLLRLGILAGLAPWPLPRPTFANQLPGRSHAWNLAMALLAHDAGEPLARILRIADERRETLAWITEGIAQSEPAGVDDVRRFCFWQP